MRRRHSDAEDDITGSQRPHDVATCGALIVSSVPHCGLVRRPLRAHHTATSTLLVPSRVLPLPHTFQSVPDLVRRLCDDAAVSVDSQHFMHLRRLT